MNGSPTSVSEIDDVCEDKSLRRHHCSAKTAEPCNKLCKQCKIFKVCGDQAIGYNFSVITCESCKAFFRRNANREKVFVCSYLLIKFIKIDLPKCPFGNKCQITVNTRRFCQLCRLKKCLQVNVRSLKVGMKREWIMSDGYRRKKRSRLTSLPEETEEVDKILNEIEDSDVTLPKAVFEKLIRRTSLPNKPRYCQCKCTCGFYPPKTQLTALVSNDNGTCQTAQLPSFSTPVQTFGFVPTSEFAQPYYQRLASSTNITTQQPPFGHSEYSVQKTPSGREMPPMMPDRTYQQPTFVQPQEVFVTVNEYSRFMNTPSQDHHLPHVTVAEAQSSILVLPEVLNCSNLTQELIIANGILKQPLDANLNLKRAEDIALMDVVRVTDLALRRIIKMAKEISYFRELSQEDQIALLKDMYFSSGSELLILRGVMVFNPSQDVWDQIITKGQNRMKIKLDVLKGAKQNQHYEEHKKFLMTFDERWRKNENVILLLSAIVLFRPDRPNIRDYNTILSNQQEYYSLFRHYLRLQCSNDIEAQQAYDLLLRKLIDLHQLSQSMMQVIYQLNVNEMDPLLLELFDLTKRTNN
uniref:Nuclear receptor domain-containing protein n=1 Tax=Syphacia muris TaxID=451379 RepID=A0A0N5AWB0_9BILA